jgi:hypothetical protein
VCYARKAARLLFQFNILAKRTLPAAETVEDRSLLIDALIELNVTVWK